MILDWRASMVDIDKAPPRRLMHTDYTVCPHWQHLVSLQDQHHYKSSHEWLLNCFSVSRVDLDHWVVGPLWPADASSR